MRDLGNIQGSAEQAKELIIGYDTVYVHSNIHKIETEDGHELYEYNEIQYDKDEYIKLMSKRNDALAEQQEFLEDCLIEVGRIIYA